MKAAAAPTLPSVGGARRTSRERHDTARDGRPPGRSRRSITPIEPPMIHETTVARRWIEILNSLGLHLRPADKFVKLALRYQSDVRVHYNGGSFNGKSILDLTSLAAECGSRLEVEARGPDAEDAVAALAALAEARFYEDDDGEPVSIEPGPGAEPPR